MVFDPYGLNRFQDLFSRWHFTWVFNVCQGKKREWVLNGRLIYSGNFLGALVGWSPQKIGTCSGLYFETSALVSTQRTVTFSFHDNESRSFPIQTTLTKYSSGCLKQRNIGPFFKTSNQAFGTLTHIKLEIVRQSVNESVMCSFFPTPFTHCD